MHQYHIQTAAMYVAERLNGDAGPFNPFNPTIMQKRHPASGILTSAAEITFQIPHTSRSTDCRCVVLLSQAPNIFITGSVQSSLVILTEGKGIHLSMPSDAVSSMTMSGATPSHTWAYTLDYGQPDYPL